MRRFAAGCALTLLGACGEQASPTVDDSFAARPSASSIPVVAGAGGDLMACLAPLHGAPEAASWYRERLEEAAGDRAPASSFELHVFHVGGPGTAPIRLEPLELSLLTAAGTIAAEPAAERLAAAGGGMLRGRLLESYAGRELAAGSSLAALVRFPGEIDLRSLRGARLRAGAADVELVPRELERERFEDLIDRPTRERVVADLGARGPAGKRER